MRFLLICAVALAVAAPLSAQDNTRPPAHISFVDGVATIEHDGQSEPAVVNMPVLEGDRLRTVNGRVEVMFPDGASIAIDPYSEVEFVSAYRVRVIAGGIEHRSAQVDPQSQSAPYLPPDLQPYSPDLDRNGTWAYEPQYGNVWYPTTVAADWRPYYDGYWETVPTYGLTWIGYERWAWPTHHYGRWGYARNRWFWIPGRSFAAAWVSWGTAPDYVSWCPLGFDGRPVLALSLGYRSAWNAWTIVPRDRFATGRFSARRYAVEPSRLASTTPFVVHRTPPSLRPGRVTGIGAAASANNGSIGVAVPRNDGSGRDYRGVNRQPRSVAGNPPAFGNVDGRATARPREPVVGNQQPAFGVQQPRATTRQAPGAGDNPAYRPRYQPNYSPTYDPQRTYRDNGPDRREPNTARPRTNDRPPVYQAPTYQAPSYQPPVYQRPNVDRPSVTQPSGRPEYRAQTRESLAAPRQAQPSYSAPRPAPPSYSAPRQAPSYSPPPSHSSPPPAAPRGGGGGGGGQQRGGGNGGGGEHARARSEGSSSSGTAVRRQR